MKERRQVAVSCVLLTYLKLPLYSIFRSNFIASPCMTHLGAELFVFEPFSLFFRTLIGQCDIMVRYHSTTSWSGMCLTSWQLAYLVGCGQNYFLILLVCMGSSWFKQEAEKNVFLNPPPKKPHPCKFGQSPKHNISNRKVSSDVCRSITTSCIWWSDSMETCSSDRVSMCWSL